MWTDDDIYRLDIKFANAGIHPHQRPIRAAREILGPNFSIGLGNTKVSEIMNTYSRLIPQVHSTWPGFGLGIAASVDEVRQIKLGVPNGTIRITAWQGLGFESPEEWAVWCRNDKRISIESHFALADCMDFALGYDEISKANANLSEFSLLALERWYMARSNIADVANALPTSFSMDSLIQPICLISELSMKACIYWHQIAPEPFSGKKGHYLAGLFSKVRELAPHRDDAIIEQLIPKFPEYVKSRYQPQGLSRLQLVKLALGAQLIAASTIRRVTNCDLAADFENDSQFGTRMQLLHQN